MKRIANLSVVLMATIFVGSAAAGGSTIVSGYGGKAGGVVGSVIAKTATKHSPPVKTHPGTLPFTGLNLTIVAVAALVLIGLGVALARVNRHPSA